MAKTPERSERREKPGKGQLIIIGGGEDRKRDAAVLQRVAEPARGGHGKLVIVTAATRVPEDYLDVYVPLFKDLGVKDLDVLDIRTREDAHADDNVEKIRGADVVFFTGGSQMRIASLMGGSPVCVTMRDHFREGATVAGTSAGAAVLPETMLIGGPGDVSPDADELDMAAGLGLISDVVIDTHFAERGRVGRLVTAVCQNPRLLGIGIDEDTALVMDRDQDFEVIGSGAVYVVDGAGISYSSIEHRPRGIVTMFDARLHVLTQEDRFRWSDRRPESAGNEDRRAA
jgi:cyanophycinase